MTRICTAPRKRSFGGLRELAVVLDEFGQKWRAYGGHEEGGEVERKDNFEGYSWCRQSCGVRSIDPRTVQYLGVALVPALKIVVKLNLKTASAPQLDSLTSSSRLQCLVGSGLS